MTTNALKNVVTGQQAAAAPKDFPAMLTAWLPEIRRALPRHLNADRMSRIALTAFRRTPKLGECDPRSVFAAVIQASQLGLEPDTLGRSYLIPYKVSKKVGNKWESHFECQFVPGWKGLVDLMNRSGQGTVWTGAVFDGDEFSWQLGDSPFVHHKPGERADGSLRYTYAIGRVKGSDWPIIDVWPIGKIWAHRDRYNKVGDKHYSFENPEMYARKIPLLQVLKYMPCSAELATAIALNDDAELGHQNIDIKDALEGEYVPRNDPQTYQDAPGDVDQSTGEVRQAGDQAPPQEAPSAAEQVRTALKLIRAGDLEAAADIAAGLGGSDATEIHNAIEQAKKAK